MPDYGITTGLPQTPAGMENKDFSKFLPVYNALNALAQAVSIASGRVTYSQEELAQRNQLGSILTQNHRVAYVLADGISLPFGTLVHLYLNGGGKICGEPADASTSAKPCHGIVDEPLGINPGEFGRVVVVEGYTQGITGTTFGQYYYLGVGGLAQAARPAAVGSIVQSVGFGLGSAGFYLHVSSYFHQN
jgi:hypothetical protein